MRSAAAALTGVLMAGGIAVAPAQAADPCRPGSEVRAMVAAFVRTIFAQPDEAAARSQLRQVAERLATSFPKAAEILLAAEDDVLAYLACPREHWTKIWSTNPLERVNRELGTATVLITHNAPIARMAERVVTLSDGRVQSDVVVPERAAPGDLRW